MSDDEVINRVNEGRSVKIKMSFFWKLMNLYMRVFVGRKNNIQCGMVFYGGSLIIGMFMDKPGSRLVIAQTTMTLAQAKGYQAVLSHEIERFEAFS